MDDGISPEDTGMYRSMRLIRRFEERAIELVDSGEIVGGIHPYIGQEAVAVGVCTALRPDDAITSTHRGHGHVLAKGADPKRMLAELCGRVTGLNRGRGGSMHAADFSLRILGANGIVGAGAPIAVGAAWAEKRRNSGAVAVSFFGDGALNQGVVLEAMNLAAIRQLPAIFVCENNGYATTLPIEAAVAGDAVSRAAAFAMPALDVDGMDVRAVRAAATEAVNRARAGDGPTLLACRTYRFQGHHTAERSMNPTYRTEAEVATWQARDPLTLESAQLSTADRAAIEQEIEETLDEAVAFARNSAPPDPADALDYIYASGLRARTGAH